MKMIKILAGIFTGAAGISTVTAAAFLIKAQKLGLITDSTASFTKFSQTVTAFMLFVAAGVFILTAIALLIVSQNKTLEEANKGGALYEKEEVIYLN